MEKGDLGRGLGGVVTRFHARQECGAARLCGTSIACGVV